MKLSKMVRFFGGLAAIALLSAATSSRMMAQSKDSAKISKLLVEARSYAVQAEDHADTLKSYTTSGLSWQSHAIQLNEMKEHVNDMGKVIANLNNARPEGSPWQQDAIDRINPLLRDLADQLSTTIKHLNDHQSQIKQGPYRDYTSANYDLASRIATLISDIVEYDKAKSKAQAEERKLELPTSGSDSQ